MAQSLTLMEPGILQQDDDDCTSDSLEDDKIDFRNIVSSNKKDKAKIIYVKHEVQISRGEIDLHKHLADCEKNPGHTQFVPVSDFDITKMPEIYPVNKLLQLLECVKVTADLTVRICVTRISRQRPEFWPFYTQEPYPLYEERGREDAMATGTGMVWDVFKWKEKDNKGTCKCQECQRSDAPSRVWGEVKMTTAAHVVFDDLEAKHTTCRLFYDRQDSPLVTLNVLKLDYADIFDDMCELTCVTCDVDLLDKLKEIVSRRRAVWALVKDLDFKRSRDGGSWAFIVSHPHGCSKQVSLGHFKNRYEVKGDKDKYTYTTATCPGSSGAHVFPLGYNDWGYDEIHVHHGVNHHGANTSGLSPSTFLHHYSA